MANDIDQTKLKQLQIIREGIKNENSAKIIRNELSENDLSYRYQDLLRDIRHQKALYHVTEKEKIDNVDNWFENVYERFRKENKLNSNQTTELWNHAKFQSATLIEDAELSSNFWDMYKEIFGE